jgi:hypothetical protein
MKMSINFELEEVPRRWTPTHVVTVSKDGLMRGVLERRA